MPGGVSDAVLIAMDMGADVTKVAVMQLVRLFFGIGMLPLFVRFADKVILKNHGDESVSLEAEITATEKTREKPSHWAVAVPMIAAAGIGGKLSGVPAGTMLFSMLTMMFIRMKLFENMAPPPLIRRIAQVLIGSYVGASVTRKEIAELPYVIVPMCIMIALFTLACLFMGLRLYKKYGFGLKEGMLCQSPAGVTEMALIAADMGVHSTNLVVIQIARVMIVMGVFPQIIAFLAGMTQ
jgi:membrane AbrB-like protein